MLLHSKYYKIQNILYLCAANKKKKKPRKKINSKLAFTESTLK